MKLMRIGALVAAFFVAGLASASLATAEEGCPANNICGYIQPNFTGGRDMVACSQSSFTLFGNTWRSARNRCGNKSNRLTSGATVVACMNPGGDRPNPGTFNAIYVFGPYGALC